MKRRRVYVIIAFLLMFALFFPFKWVTYADGTKELSAIAVKYVSWHYTTSIGGEVLVKSTTKLYFFPENQKDFETLRDEFFSKRIFNA